jgi:hypothetical protein
MFDFDSDFGSAPSSEGTANHYQRERGETVPAGPEIPSQATGETAQHSPAEYFTTAEVQADGVP